MDGKNPRQRQSAFTMVELMVAIGIMVMITVMTLPVVAPLMKSRALDSTYNRIYGAVYKARGLAANYNAVYCLAFNSYNPNNMMVIYCCTATTATVTQGNPTTWTWGNDYIVDEPIPLEKGTRLLALASEIYKDSAFSTANDVSGKLIPGEANNSSYLAFFPSGEVMRYHHVGGVDMATYSSAYYDTIAFCNTAGDVTSRRSLKVILISGEMYK